MERPPKIFGQPRTDAKERVVGTNSRLGGADGQVGRQITVVPRENNQQAISLNLIGTQVKKILDQKPDIEILLRGDRTIDYGQVVKLMTILQQAGATSVGLISDRP